jgi:hypothetical protein
MATFMALLPEEASSLQMAFSFGPSPRARLGIRVSPTRTKSRDTKTSADQILNSLMRCAAIVESSSFMVQLCVSHESDIIFGCMQQQTSMGTKLYRLNH